MPPGPLKTETSPYTPGPSYLLFVSRSTCLLETYYMFIAPSLQLVCQPWEDKDFVLLFPAYPQCSEQCLAHSGGSVNIWSINKRHPVTSHNKGMTTFWLL